MFHSVASVLTTALLAGSALAAPAPQGGAPESVAISGLSVNKLANGTLASVSFQLSGQAGTDVSCYGVNPAYPEPSQVYKCGDSPYRFGLVKGTEYDYGLRIYHELGTAVGKYGQGDVFTYCHTGGLENMLCNQLYPTSITIR